MGLKSRLYSLLKRLPYTKDVLYGDFLYTYYKREFKVDKRDFIKENIRKFYLQDKSELKGHQIRKLVSKVDICPVENNMFFYSVDCFKSLKSENQVLDNFTVDYKVIVAESFKEIESILKTNDSYFSKNEIETLNALKEYIERCKKTKPIYLKFESALDAAETLFYRSAESFYEALQRILFFNQFLWQTNHKHNGFGRLDMILIDLYKKDIESKKINCEEAKEMLRHFFWALHEHYWFKSGMLLGDTGQIIILGGLNPKGEYVCNELTYLFLEVSKELQLTDPKVLLRCSKDMPEDLLKLALESIATGIGAPFLSNDDAVIPCLCEFGYDENDSYEYCASACWEPLVINGSCDLNNVKSINFATPFIELLDNDMLYECNSIDDILLQYELALRGYISNELKRWENHEFEIDPIISLVSHSALEKQMDITRGGAIYNNLGFTSVGLSSVVDSLFNIKDIVFDKKEYSLKEFNEMRKRDFSDNNVLVERMKNHLPGYGCDDNVVIEITNRITEIAEKEFKMHSTKYGGKFKFGLSSPFYVTEGLNASATFDGRYKGSPFNVHISSSKSIPTTQLFSFAMKLDYSGHKLNGNVIDFFLTPNILKENMDKYMQLLKVGFREGIYQLQINVVDSQTLIKAKENPELFPNLIVRVWGFSAYFKDLPTEYKDIIIRRALESENAA